MTQGILNLLTDEELEGVLAHELGTCVTATSSSVRLRLPSPAPSLIWQQVANGE